MRDAVIVSAARTAVAKASKGALRETPPPELAAAAIREAIARAPGLDAAEVEDLVLGCAMPEGAQGLNIARHVALGAGLPVSSSAMTVNRFCASGLQALAIASGAVASGIADVVVAGGLESMSFVPMTGWHFDPDAALAGGFPGVFVNMGLTAEAVAERYGVEREAQDAWALRSHQRAAAAQDAGRFRDEIVPVMAHATALMAGRPAVQDSIFEADEGIRRDTDATRLAALRPVFRAGGTVTAGNSSQTSDGASALILASEKAVKQFGLTPLARFVSFASRGVPPEIMGIGPIEAIPAALRYAGLKIEDIGWIELNEAFAAQSLAVINTVGLDRAKVNPMGGAIALGHPLGATGAIRSATVIHALHRHNLKYGMVTMCVGTGQGAAGIFERL